jgi:hypothetical protein
MDDIGSYYEKRRQETLNLLAKAQAHNTMTCHACAMIAQGGNGRGCKKRRMLWDAYNDSKYVGD